MSAATPPVPPRAVLLLAASMGGPDALRDLCPRVALPPGAAALIVQHIEEGFAPGLAAGLATDAGWPVRVARAGDRLAAGDVLLAPGGRDLRLDADGTVILTSPAPGKPAPSVDRALSSAAAAYGPGLVAVLLTGMGVDDGLEGTRAVKARGGRTLAQDERSAKSFGMAREAVREGLVDEVAPLEDLARRIVRALRAVLGESS